MNNLSLDDSIGYDKDGNEITLGEVLKMSILILEIL